MCVCCVCVLLIIIISVIFDFTLPKQEFLHRFGFWKKFWAAFFVHWCFVFLKKKFVIWFQIFRINIFYYSNYRSIFWVGGRKLKILGKFCKRCNTFLVKFGTPTNIASFSFHMIFVCFFSLKNLFSQFGAMPVTSSSMIIVGNYFQCWMFFFLDIHSVAVCIATLAHYNNMIIIWRKKWGERNKLFLGLFRSSSGLTSNNNNNNNKYIIHLWSFSSILIIIIIIFHYLLFIIIFGFKSIFLLWLTSRFIIFDEWMMIVL